MQPAAWRSGRRAEHYSLMQLHWPSRTRPDKVGRGFFINSSVLQSQSAGSRSPPVVAGALCTLSFLSERGICDMFSPHTHATGLTLVVALMLIGSAGLDLSVQAQSGNGGDPVCEPPGDPGEPGDPGTGRPFPSSGGGVDAWWNTEFPDSGMFFDRRRGGIGIHSAVRMS